MTVSYTYDAMDRMVSVKGVDGVTTKYSYDALGRRTATTGGKTKTSYAYDEVGNLVSQTTTGAYDLALGYVYDKSGRMTGETRTEQGTTLESSYVYDALGQLTGFTRSDGLSESYAYDAVGNMTAKTANGIKTAMTYNAANQLVKRVSGGETTKYSYDANGNLVKAENSDGARSYAYNALGLLSQFTREDGYSESYSYNANRLLSGITNQDGTTSFTYDILYGEGVVIGESRNGQTTNYTYGLDRISAITGSTRTEYVYDGRGSVAAEVSYNKAWYTFNGGLAKKNVTSKSYTPFGEQLGEAATGFGYNGEYYNAATGMVYLRARFYEPELNRFSQKDLLRGEVIQPGSLNRYLYVQNDPINFIDPSGMKIDWQGAWDAAKNFGNKLVETGTKVVNTVVSAVSPGRSQAGSAGSKARTQTPSPDSSAYGQANKDKTQQQQRNGGQNATSPSYGQNPGQVPNQQRISVINLLLQIFDCADKDKNDGSKGDGNAPLENPGPIIALGSVTVDLGAGWSYRIDIVDTPSGPKRHIHILAKGGREYMQNEDGSPHDKGRGTKGKIPKWVQEEIMEREGWDYNGKRDDFYNKTKIAVGESGEVHVFNDGTVVDDQGRGIVPNRNPARSVDNEEEIYYSQPSDAPSGIIQGKILIPFNPSVPIPVPVLPGVPLPVMP